MQNEYITKFEKLSNVELQKILLNKDDYKDDAVAAATYIYEQRLPLATLEAATTEHQLLEFEKEKKSNSINLALRKIKNFLLLTTKNRLVDQYYYWLSIAISILALYFLANIPDVLSILMLIAKSFNHKFSVLYLIDIAIALVVPFYIVYQLANDKKNGWIAFVGLCFIIVVLQSLTFIQLIKLSRNSFYHNIFSYQDYINKIAFIICAFITLWCLFKKIIREKLRVVSNDIGKAVLMAVSVFAFIFFYVKIFIA